VDYDSCCDDGMQEGGWINEVWVLAWGWCTGGDFTEVTAYAAGDFAEVTFVHGGLSYRNSSLGIEYMAHARR
jgi:hypothetical protein